MRSQFNKVGTGYHVSLGQPTVHAPVTLTVPAGKGGAYLSGRQVPFGLVDASWFSSRIQQYMGQQHTDPTHLPIFLTDNVMLYAGTVDNCCIIGYHGASVAVGNGSGSTHGQGRQGVQTFAYSRVHPARDLRRRQRRRGPRSFATSTRSATRSPNGGTTRS